MTVKVSVDIMLVGLLAENDFYFGGIFYFYLSLLRSTAKNEKG